MSEKQEQNDYRRHQIIQEAVISADRIIMDNSDGSERETNYLTAIVAMELMHIAFLPLDLRIIFFKPGNLPKRDIIQKAIEAALEIVADSHFINKEEADYLIAEVAKEFADKSLSPFSRKMLEKDLKRLYGGDEIHGKPESAGQ